MSDNKTTVKKISKKEVREIIYSKLEGALAEYKSSIKEKKFVTNLKKASKLFATDIAKAYSKRNDKPKNVKKITKPKKSQPPPAEQPVAANPTL